MGEGWQKVRGGYCMVKKLKPLSATDSGGLCSFPPSSWVCVEHFLTRKHEQILIPLHGRCPTSLVILSRKVYYVQVVAPRRGSTHVAFISMLIANDIGPRASSRLSTGVQQWVLPLTDLFYSKFTSFPGADQTLARRPTWDDSSQPFSLVPHAPDPPPRNGYQ